MAEAILNQAWEDVADDVTGAIEKAVQPLLKKAVDDIYGGLLDATQDYLKDNLAFNIASRISTAEREARDARQRAEALEADNQDLRASLAVLVDVFQRDDENSVERFERLAAMFRSDTGFLAPGKDQPMGGADQPDGEELRAIYDSWYAAKVHRARTALARGSAA